MIVTYDATHDHGLCVECGEVAVFVEWLPCGNGRCEDCARGCCYDPDPRGFETISITLADVETLWGESCGNVATLCAWGKAQPCPYSAHEPTDPGDLAARIHELEAEVSRLSKLLSNGTNEYPPRDLQEPLLHPTWKKRTAGSLAKHLRSLVEAAPILPGPNAGKFNGSGCKLPCRVPSPERLKAGHLAKAAERWLAEPGGKGRKGLPLTVEVVRDMFAKILATRSPKALSKRRLLDVLRKDAP